MPTNKPKVTGYLDYENYDDFEKFRREHGLTASQALNKLVEIVFKDDTLKDRKKAKSKTSKEEVRHSEQGIALEEYVTDLVNERVTTWRDTIFTDQWLASFCQTYQFSVAPSTSLLEDPASREWVEELVNDRYLQAMGQVGGAIANLREELTLLINTSSTAQSGSPTSVYTLEEGSRDDSENGATQELPKNLSGADLARRLKCSPSMITQQRRKNNFASWTASKDPDGFAWKYDKDKARTIYKPLSFEKESLV